MGGVAVSGNHLPNPLPPRVRRHSSTSQTRAKRARRFTEHARDRPVWQCRLPRTPTSREPDGRDLRPPPVVVGRTGARRRVVVESSSGSRRSVAAVSDRSVPTFAPLPDRDDDPEPGPAGRHPSGTRRAAGRRYGPRPASGHPADTVRPSPDRPWGRMEAAAPVGRTPVERMISAHATVYFQPTSLPSQSLAEMADQPPCQQAEGDRAVRFHPMGTGHERQAHFPARLTSETLRDRMLPARLPCRHKAGW